MLLLHLLQGVAATGRVKLVEETELHLLHSFQALNNDSLSIIYLLQLTDLLKLFILPQVLVSHLGLDRV